MATILCIDDDRETLEARDEVLRSSGYTVLMASNGIDALEMLSSGAHVDLVVIDYLMPGMDGDRVVQSLRATFLICP